jgi:hypothetical protein
MCLVSYSSVRLLEILAFQHCQQFQGSSSALAINDSVLHP